MEIAFEGIKYEVEFKDDDMIVTTTQDISQVLESRVFNYLSEQSDDEVTIACGSCVDGFTLDEVDL